ncbi:hypothetical protein [Aminobacter aminovorans]|uniref:hypothetical protein n=1 Tax=Aminobacter aminovorans TaxID=83263 RepID=UPI00285AB873|nr:hypothetical protein [Aminobacter aminovorans]MDR7220356.1 putative secreted protein [Aminobacter aminovorans]
MAVHHGKNGKVKLATDLVAETTKWSVAESVAVADTTAQGDLAQTHLPGIPGWSAKIEGNYDPADADGQVVLAIGASVQLGLYSDGDGVGKKYFTGTATVISRTIESDMGDATKFSVDLTGNGPLTIATVPV